MKHIKKLFLVVIALIGLISQESQSWRRGWGGRGWRGRGWGWGGWGPGIGFGIGFGYPYYGWGYGYPYYGGYWGYPYYGSYYRPYYRRPIYIQRPVVQEVEEVYEPETDIQQDLPNQVEKRNSEPQTVKIKGE